MDKKKPAPGANLGTGYGAAIECQHDSSPFESLKHPAIDPLLGWHNLAKNARLNRKQKRTWNRGRK